MSKTKNSATAGRDQVLVSNIIASTKNASPSKENQELSCKLDLINFWSDLLLQKRLKACLILSVIEILCPLGSLACIDFEFHEIERSRGHKSALWIIYLPTRHTLSFFRRRKRPPSVSLQCLIITLKAISRDVKIERSDEDGSLSESCKFSMLLEKNITQL